MNRQLITFEVEGQTFGIDIMGIREIRAWSPTTRLPRVPDFVAGVVNLRGIVLPVIDLAARLGWNKSNPGERHVIIVTEVNGQLKGMIVDAVRDIVTFDQAALQPPPTTGDEVLPFLEGLASLDDRMVMVLDLAALTHELEYRDAA
ncbi:chemotaxis protein CheW [Blastomonas sp. AAP53]|uniref:chemotaxis protein CheW n=1 Tax=Blastomonas sp. AAP53 TaxID=1248760 RepID=UPI00030B3FAA|nr:chemotaxis protein CheW [Blastomonas sp. AAP53]